MNVAVFIDASNVWQAQKSKGRIFDYDKLKKFLINTYDTSSIKIFYYAAYPREGTREYDLEGKHKFFTFLSKGLGFIVRKKELKRIVVVEGVNQIVQEKGNMDVEMTIDAVQYKDTYDAAVFFTGDSDFLAVINYLKNKGKKVYIFSSKGNISHELKTSGSGYFDILKISADIWGRKIEFRSKQNHPPRGE